VDPSISYSATILGISSDEGGEETTVPNGSLAIEASPDVSVSAALGIDICSDDRGIFSLHMVLSKVGAKAVVTGAIERLMKAHDVSAVMCIVENFMCEL